MERTNSCERYVGAAHVWSSFHSSFELPATFRSEQVSTFRNCPSGILPLLTPHPSDPTTLTSTLNPGNPSRKNSSHIFLCSPLVTPRRAAGAVHQLPDKV